MTPKEILEETRSILSDTNRSYPVTDGILYGRMNARHRELFSMAAMWNEEYFGRVVRAPLRKDGCVDLTDLEDGKLWPIERVDHVEIAQEGKNPFGYERDDKVTICKASERFRHFQPRVTIRSHLMEPVKDVYPSDSGGSDKLHDLEGVESLRIWYSRRPRKIDGRGFVNGKPEEVEIGDPWEWLLVWDLVRHVIKVTTVEEGEEKDPVFLMAVRSEEALLASFEAHVKGYSAGAEAINEG